MEVLVPTTTHRDLASEALWQQSLERSRRRRVLAEQARKQLSRRRTASFAVTAAVATSPVVPTLAASAGPSTKQAKKLAKKLRGHDGQRILLEYGDTSSAVAQVQRALHIPDDGIFGPQTQAAVRAFQKREHLPVTGAVDVRTWLTLFPNDMVLYAPASAVKALGVSGGGGPAWTAVHAPDVATADGAPGDGQAAQVAARLVESTGTGAAGREFAVDGRGADAHGAVVNAAGVNAAAAAAASDLVGAPGGSDSPQIVTPPSAGSGAGANLGVGSGGEFAPSGGGGGGGGGGGAGGGGGGGGGGLPLSHFHFPRNATIGQMISAMIAAANRIDRHHYAYSWGGGHNASFSGPYDCSGAVSAVLHAAGLLSSPRVSGDFMHWGAPGPGAVTLYANPGHVYMSILGHYFGTSHANPGGGAGWFRGGPRPGFAVVHVPFSLLLKHRSHHRAHRRARATRWRRAHTGAPPPQVRTAAASGSVASGGALAPESSPKLGPAPSTDLKATTTSAPTAPAPATTSAPATTAAPAPAPPAPTTTAAPAAAPQAPAATTEQAPVSSAPSTTAQTQASGSGSESAGGSGSGSPGSSVTTGDSGGQAQTGTTSSGAAPAPTESQSAATESGSPSDSGAATTSAPSQESTASPATDGVTEKTGAGESQAAGESAKSDPSAGSASQATADGSASGQSAPAGQAAASGG